MKNIVVFTSLNDECLPLLKNIKNKEIFVGASVHFYHCFEVNVYTTDLSPYIFPVEEQYPEIEASSLKILENTAKELLTDEDFKHAKFTCEFSQNVKQKSVDFLKGLKPDCAVLATRGKHGIEGFFTSSFVEHLIKFSPCDLYVARPHE